MINIGLRFPVRHLEDDTIVCSLTEGSKCHPRIAESDITSSITGSK